MNKDQIRREAFKQLCLYYLDKIKDDTGCYADIMEAILVYDGDIPNKRLAVNA